MSAHLAGDHGRLPTAAAVATAMFTAALVVPAALRARQFSLYDEPSHADYAYRVSLLQLPAPGSPLTPTVLEEWSCRGSPLVDVPSCSDAPRPASEYPLRGENYNHGHPPLYYLVVGPTARAIDALVPGGNFFAVARLLGLLWLLGGMAVLYLALSRFGVEPFYATAAVAVMPLTPGVLHASSTVTNDATAVLCGAVALLVAGRILVDGQRGWLVPAAATGLVTALKVIGALPMLGIACIVAGMGVAQWRRDRPGARRLLAIGAAIVVTFVLVFEGWTTFQGLRGVDDWVSPIAALPERMISGSPVDELLSTSFTGLQMISSYWLPSEIAGGSIRLWSRLLALLVSAAPLVAMLAFAPRRPRWLIGAATLGGLLAFPLVAELQVYVQNDQYLPTVVGRYGLSFVPWALACLAMVAGARGLLRTTVAIVATGALVMVLSVYGVFTLGP